MGWLKGLWEKTWGKAVIIAVSLFVGLTIITAAIGDPDKETDGAPAASSVATEPPASTQEPATTTETTTTEEPATTQEEPPATTTEVDTGRMSDTEYSLLEQQIEDVRNESAQFGDTVPKCGVLIQALALADASDCLDEAYSGFEDDWLGAYQYATDTKGDVDKTCRRWLVRWQHHLDLYGTRVKRLHDVGANLQFAQFTALAGGFAQLVTRYQRASTRVLAACRPT